MSSSDLVLGPVRYPRLLRGFADQEPITSPNFVGDGYFYKVGTVLAPGARATVSIPEPAASYAGIVTMSAGPSGDASVTFVGCPDSRYGTAWVGGFVLHGRSIACIPLRVVVAGQPRPYDAVISLKAGNCANARV